MEKYAWKAKIADGMLEEYIRRHDNLWDEMKIVMKKAGICNYTIWNVGNELFGYHECKYGHEYAVKILGESDVAARWDRYMEDILIMERCPETGEQPVLCKVFTFE